MDDIQQRFTDRLKERGIELNERQLEQFETYYKLLVEWNEKMNLTGITEREQVYEKHFYDSLTLAFFVDMKKVKSLADIGSGAGFPGVPLKIVFPHLKLSIIDSLNKRITFLKAVSEGLGLTGAEFLHGRAEDWGHKRGYRDAFDLVTARAVARLAVLNEFCLPFVKPQGTFAAMKGTDPAEEIAESKKSLRELRGELESVEAFRLPFDDSERHIIRIAKTAITPYKYPRNPGLPLKSPLV
ncbi:16S rRNA (guanine(527)-N(7))-methyltransferase RsmG [Saccharibacillus sp. CPCC 101409]|uniref:16S rRNA (guanine(527)-N(7))-methyltransferase RsmG n=1 Tax=Saccharibacillus sp. CPCC 101409 TaxID=3058041 RepID=UPI0026740501|nr:16S rRNA (guanine(527)-N(7))-methyltransferase RsmG [Saccharibacillus sp. CPCC 101409]MDO3413227.1 16S rRNA (guanine(527)-N(7))-methyltransferase RsmG [Saccharibacillus sp. CPCC 101409]